MSVMQILKLKVQFKAKEFTSDLDMKPKNHEIFHGYLFFQETFICLEKARYLFLSA
jgi:hypothetical protein